MQGQVSVAVGGAGCTHWSELFEMNLLLCPFQATGETELWYGSVGPLPLCSQVLLQPAGVPPVPAQAQAVIPMTVKEDAHQNPTARVMM